MSYWMKFRGIAGRIDLELKDCNAMLWSATVRSIGANDGSDNQAEASSQAEATLGALEALGKPASEMVY